MTKQIKIEARDGVTIMTIDRPDALNALNGALLREVLDYLNEAARSKTHGPLILTGSGEKAFIAGADIKAMSMMSSEEILRFCETGQQVANALENAPFLTLASVNGYALGGGLEMALACDFIYASENAKMGLPEVTLGVIPGFGGTQRLGRAAGTRRAKEMIMSGMIIDAHKGREYGIVNEIFPGENLMEASLNIAKKVASLPKTATISAKKSINKGCLTGIEEGLKAEIELFATCFATEDRVQAMEAFINRGAKKK